MLKRKDVLTTGQVAQICSVAPRTVTKWFDNGQLKGYRIPGSRDRRIPTSELMRFMKAHNMPTDQLEAGNTRVMIIDDWEMSSALENALSRHNFEVETAQNSFDAGIIAHKFAPHVIFINLSAENIDAAQICRNVRANQDLQGTKVVAIAAGLTQTELTALTEKGFDSAVSDPADIKTITRTIEQLTTILY